MPGGVRALPALRGEALAARRALTLRAGTSSTGAIKPSSDITAPFTYPARRAYNRRLCVHRSPADHSQACAGYVNVVSSSDSPCWRRCWRCSSLPSRNGARPRKKTRSRCTARHWRPTAWEAMTRDQCNRSLKAITPITSIPPIPQLAPHLFAKPASNRLRSIAPEQLQGIRRRVASRLTSPYQTAVSTCNPMSC